MASERLFGKLLILNGGQGQDRTAAAGLFGAGGCDRVNGLPVSQADILSVPWFRSEGPVGARDRKVEPLRSQKTS